MLSTFVNHELKAFWRSKNTGKSVAIRVVMAVLILYFLVNALFLGVFLDKILEAVFPLDDVLVSFCGILLLYFFFDLLMRMQLQELPTLRVQPYLHLPIKRNTLVKYLAATSLLSAFNIWPFVFFLPFIFKVVIADSGVAALAFIISIAGLTVFNNYLALFIKRKSNLNGWVFLASGAVLVLINLGDFMWHLYSIRDISYAFFGRMVTQPLLALVPVGMCVGVYYLNFVYLKRNLYLEDLGSGKVSAYKNSTEYPVLNRFGKVGDLVAIEIKLILRNKRSRSALVMCLFFMFYGLIFYLNPTAYGEWSKVFVGMFMTGIFIINYGQFMFSWQASHFDGILVSKIKFTDFIKAKYLLFTIVSTLAFLLTTPYVYFGWRVLLIHFIMYVWNLGVNTTIILFFANRNQRRMDLSKGASFNWEGVGATQFLVSLPLLLTPFVIYMPFKFLGYADAGLVILLVVGVLGILLRPWFTKKLEEDFNTKKFGLAEGFRNK
ncbi:hypothetical protein DJ568_11940 [Mucilaginibacter hurinus]|uniref:Uncharacterized protein n=1 Tax=Mucilaginibacter hurinus TaxID=2201324 RepID=A0A367GM27_9SPHI|nr:DUF5687 family protein [Mucilaginibacter hurinus]RCH54527.1 hypothetical protein DJ568_11940 [Mucilaginibacter hurinus]